MKPLVIGLGNPLRGDDAAGLLVARRLIELADPQSVEVVELEGEPARLLDAWEGAELAIVVDALSSGGEEGELSWFDVSGEPLPAGARAASTHALGLAEVIELGRALGRLPARLVVIGIEGANFSVGSAPTDAVLRAVEAAAASVAADPARPLSSIPG